MIEMKRPKYILQEKRFPNHQKTLAESWFCKNSKAEANCENQSNNGNSSNVDAKFKKPLRLKSQDLQNSSIRNSAFKNKENESDGNHHDKDIVANSQSSSKSELRKKIDKSLLRKSASSEVSTQRKKNASNSSERKFSSSDLCDLSFIKDELLTDMFENIDEYEPFEMCHDLSDVLVDPQIISNILSSPIISMEVVEGQVTTDPLEDPLHINKNDMLEHSSKSLCLRKRTRSGNLDKSISKKVRYVCNSDDEEKCNSTKSKSKNKKIENSLSHELQKKLKLLKIQLQHRVPPQHKIEKTAGSKPMSIEMKKEFETYGPLKVGPFTESEDKIIRKNWRDFCEIHEWDENIVQPFLNMRHEGKYYISDIMERKNFVRFLANELPWRCLYSVYYRFKNIFNKAVGTGQYTEKEDKIIMSHMCDTSIATVSNKCAEVAKILKRKRHSVWQRFQRLKIMHNLTSTKTNLNDYESDESDCSTKKKKKKAKAKSNKKKKSNNDKKIQRKINHKKVYTKFKWTTPLVNKFIQTLMNVTSSDNLQDLKYNKINDNVWIKAEKSMSIDRATLQTFWYNQLHLQLFSPTPIYLNDTKIDLIEYMNENKDKNLEDILWEDVCLRFDGVTTEFLSKLFDNLVQYARKNINSDNLKDVVQYLYKYHLRELEDKTEDVILPKLYFKGNRIIGVDKGTENKIPNRGPADPFADADEY